MSGMKKLLSTGLLALLTTAYLTSSCSRDDFSGSIIEAKKQAFSDNFKAAYGTINPLQDWGFGSATTRGWALTRSMSNPSVPGITQPYSEEWVATYMETAKEPTSTNVAHDYDNGTTFAWSDYIYNGIANDSDYDWFVEYCQHAVSQDWSYYGTQFGLEDYTWNKVLAWLYPQIIARGHSDWMKDVTIDQDYVLNFKITDTWEGNIKVAGDGERTIVIGNEGIWYINDQDQTMGGETKIIIASGGTIHITSGNTLNLVNQLPCSLLRMFFVLIAQSISHSKQG